MTWNPPKTDWTASDGVTNVDMNRIEGNTKQNHDDLAAHEADTNNPHNTSKSQVGLGSVANYGIATQADAEAGTSDAKYMTPLKTKQAIQKLAPTPTSTSISLEDAGNYFTTDNVEAALQEIGQTLNSVRGNLIASVNSILNA